MSPASPIARAPAALLTLAALALHGCAPADGTADAAITDSGPEQERQLRVGLYQGDGVWPEGRAALETLLDTEPLSVVSVSAAQVAGGALGELDAIVVGGGWAWDLWSGLGAGGISALRAFVLGGGGYYGVCAGAYLASDDVIWEGEWVAYPLNLFDGVAEGPLAAYPWPESSVVSVERVAGEHPLQDSGTLDAYYQGGAAFLARDPSAVDGLLRYDDGSLAALAFAAGAGRVVLNGVHLEINLEDTDAGIAEDGAGAALLRELVSWVARATP